MPILNFLLFIFLVNAHAFEGVVLTAQTPLFLKESDTSDISEYRLKGDIIYIHGSYNTARNSFQNDDFNQTKFYRSIDRIGRDVYVKAADVFIYFNDEREIEVLTE